MSVLTIRSHRRYAVRGTVELHRQDGSSVRGLMIEVSADGCRLSNLGRPGFREGEKISLTADAGFSLNGMIRWAHGSVAGLRLAEPLLSRELAEIVEAGREEIPVACYA